MEDLWSSSMGLMDSKLDIPELGGVNSTEIVSIPKGKTSRDSCLLALVIMAIASSALIITYRTAERTLFNVIQGRLRDLAVVTAAEMNGDLHVRITTPDQVGSHLYRQASDPLIRLRKSVPDVYYAYTLRGSHRDLRFVLDSSHYIKNQGDNSSVPVIGQRYDDAPADALTAARYGRVTVSSTPYTDQWGTALSSYAPFREGDGKSTALVAVDLSLATLNRQLFPLRMSLGLSLAGSALLSGLTGFLHWRSLRSTAHALTVSMQARDLALRAAAESEQANRAKTTFLATMGHEIRTPLNGVIGLTSILLSTSLSSEQRTCLQTVKNSGESLLLLLSQLLDFAAIESGSVVVEPAPVPIRPILEEVLSLFAELAQSKGLHTSFTLSGDIPEVVLTDPYHLRQILQQLVGNAIKFTASGTVEVAVSCQALRPDGKVPLLFRIRDSGSGLSNTEIQKIFQPFIQGDSSSTRVHGGLGLGLAICRGLVDALGGTIQAESELGGGTTLLVTIPVVPTVQPVISSFAAGDPAPAETDTFAASHPLRILLVEDNPVNVRVCELMLRRLGYAVSVASDGEEGLLQQQRLDPDLILMDLRMPKLDGLEATRRIRDSCGEGHRPWIAAITANARESDRAEALGSGMNDFISKPIQVERLRSVLLRAHGAIQNG